MKALITKPCTCVCGPGSIVEITQDQFLALGDAAVVQEGLVSKMNTKPKATKKPTKPKTTKAAKKE